HARGVGNASIRVPTSRLVRRKYLRRRFLDPRAQPFAAGFGFFVAEADDLEEFAVADCLSGLDEDDPGDFGLLRAEVEVAEVAEEKHSRHFTAAEQLGAFMAQSLEQAGRLVDAFVARCRAVPVGEGGE